MVTAVKLFAVLLGFLFPVFLIRAVRAGPEDHDRVTNYTALYGLIQPELRGAHLHLDVPPAKWVDSHAYMGT